MNGMSLTLEKLSNPPDIGSRSAIEQDTVVRKIRQHEIAHQVVARCDRETVAETRRLKDIRPIDDDTWVISAAGLGRAIDPHIAALQRRQRGAVNAAHWDRPRLGGAVIPGIGDRNVEIDPQRQIRSWGRIRRLQGLAQRDHAVGAGLAVEVTEGACVAVRYIRCRRHGHEVRRGQGYDPRLV